MKSNCLYLGSIKSDDVKILSEDLYLNKTSMKTIQRIHAFVFYHEQELDARYIPSLVLYSEQFNSVAYIKKPLYYISNQNLIDVIKQRDVQQITFSGKISKLSAEKLLKDYWQNPAKQGFININVIVIERQEYLSSSLK